MTNSPQGPFLASPLLHHLLTFICKNDNNALARNGSLARNGHLPVGMGIDESKGKPLLLFRTLVTIVLLMYCLWCFVQDQSEEWTSGKMSP